MRYLETNGVKLSRIGLGTWQFGSKDWGYGTDYAEGEAGRIVARALELGVNLIDTAELYGRGNSETIVGRAIAGHRDEVFVASKFAPIVPTASLINKHGRKSAERLGINRIDLYQLHWPNPVVPIARQMEGIRRLQRAGIVDHAGVSNYSLSRWKAAEAALGTPVLSNQVQYSLAVRKPDQELVPYAAANDRIVIAYSPLAKGLLSGRYDATNLPKNSARRNDPLFVPENLARAHDLIETLRSIAKAHDATAAQVALAWLVTRPNVVAIPGASSVAQLEANAAAADLDLSDSDVEELTAASDAFRPLGTGTAYREIAKRRITRK